MSLYIFTITHISANSAKPFTIAKTIPLQPVSYASTTYPLILSPAIAMPRQRWNRTDREIERITSSLDDLDQPLLNDRLVLLRRHSAEAKEVWDELMSQDYTIGFHRVLRNMDGGDGARLRLVGKVLLACCLRLETRGTGFLRLNTKPTLIRPLTSPHPSIE